MQQLQLAKDVERRLGGAAITDAGEITGKIDCVAHGDNLMVTERITIALRG
ncbi:conserved hypothetical protein [Burkholderia pseudomallei Pakistan 9]|nr:conserved hypothetical protein [Burkholderia pseudomallei 576]EEH26292.1 conserved hypothetical protein [Burkholderia pseudomallei Pakistan 9]EEP51407.1 conserved hypothetical protein [Burkholderia pseudomallei MSHR346]